MTNTTGGNISWSHNLLYFYICMKNINDILNMLQSVLSAVRVSSTKPVLVMYVEQRLPGSSFSSVIVPSEEQFTVPTTTVFQRNGYTYNLLECETYIWPVIWEVNIRAQSDIY